MPGVLVLAVEDYTGFSNFPAYAQKKKPNYLSYYTNALNANGVGHDVYDYDAMQRKAPDPLGVLSHYDAVVWYTGNDNVTRSPNVPGVADLEAHRTITAVRDFVNEGGRVSIQGVHAERQWNLVEYPQEGFPLSQCDGDLQTTNDGKCQPLSDDFAQYYLGAYLRSDGGGLSASGSPFPVAGTAGGPLDSLTFNLDGPDSAKNQHGDGFGTGNFLVTSSILSESDYPQFASDQAADWLLSGGAPFDPHTGTKYMFSQNASEGYKRMHRTVDLTGVTGTQPANLSFWTSFNTELDWDFVFVEARTVGARTTGPRCRTRTGTRASRLGQAAPRAGMSSTRISRATRRSWRTGPARMTTVSAHRDERGVARLERQLGRLAELVDRPVRLPWQAGRAVDRLRYGLGHEPVPGALIDDTSVTAGPRSRRRSRRDQGGWEHPGTPRRGPSINRNDWIQSERIPFEDAAVTVSDFGLMFGFGLEGVSGAGNRAVPDGPHAGPPAAVAGAA